MTTKKKVLRFLLIFFIILAAEFILLYFLMPRAINDFLRETTAIIVFNIVSLLGVSAKLAQDIISLPNLQLKIVYECTGAFAFFVYSSAILAFPAGTWQKKLIGHIIGLLAIVILNIIRLIVIIFVGLKSRAAFEFIHDYLWQGTFIIFVLLIWIIWLEKIANKQHPKTKK